MRAALACLAIAAGVSAAHAAGVADRVREAGVVHCGAVPRPGLYDTAADGAATGALVDLCARVGAAAAGRPVAVVMTAYEFDGGVPARAVARDDLAFLTREEAGEPEVARLLAAGPVVATLDTVLVVDAAAATVAPADLAGQPICFMQGTDAHRALEAWASATGRDVVRMGFQEDVELDDSFAVRHCVAVAAEASALSGGRFVGLTPRHARVLPQAIGTMALVATTPVGDAAFADLVARAAGP